MLPQNPPAPSGPQAGGGQPPQASQGDIKAQLLQAIQAIMQVAQQNGIDFMSVVKEAMQQGGAGAGAQASPPPPPPAP